MLDVVSFTPPWLSRPSPGSSFFSGHPSNQLPGKQSQGAAVKEADTAGSDSPYDGPTRVIARRGREVFTVVDNQIRWANLVTLRDEWRSQEAENRKPSKQGKDRNDGKSGKQEEGPLEDGSQNYRVLNVPVYSPIRQLIVSPNEAFMTIVTTNTVHISVLPDPVHLSGPDFSPLRIKTHQLGPTTHVLPESPVISALWHPLGVFNEFGGCLVTVTADAAVRVWELDRNNQWSFDRPTLAIDLKKLIDGTSLDEDFAPSGFGKNKGFSADDFDMEVASACFGGSGFEEEDGWAPMTLWVAMKSGMLYALCPLLPSKWQARSATIASLTTSIIPKMKSIAGDSSATDDERRACQQQYDWLKEIDTQEPLSVPRGSEAQVDTETRNRPTNPSAIPRLQGPFQFDMGDESDDLDLTDILVIPAKSDVDELLEGEDAEFMLENDAGDGLSATVICLVTANSRVHVCLDFDGVQGQWLPKADKGTFSTPASNPSDLILLESLETVRGKYQQENSWPTLTQDVHSRYDFFVTSANNVTFISLSSWAQRLQAELQSPDASGSAFRLKVLCDGSLSQRQELVQIQNEEPSAENTPEHMAASLVLYDYDLGYLLLTRSIHRPYAVVFDTPSHLQFSTSQSPSMFETDLVPPQPVLVAPPRIPYQPPSILYSPSPLDQFAEKNIPGRHKHSTKEEIRLSPATLDVVAAAHRILSAHTNTLERAASDLFRRCERLQGEMHDQLNHLSDAAERIKGVENELSVGDQQNGGSPIQGSLDARMKAAVSRQSELLERYENVRNNLTKSGGRPLSEKERLWMNEVNQFSRSLNESEKPQTGELSQRLQTARSLAQELLSQGKQLTSENTPNNSPARSGVSSTQPKIPHKLQRAKIADAMSMVDRESAVIDAMSSRLERLNTTNYPELPRFELAGNTLNHDWEHQGGNDWISQSISTEAKLAVVIEQTDGIHEPTVEIRGLPWMVQTDKDRLAYELEYLMT
ncbi:hypothetical protein FQN54_000793 [Arachnomyces sp. PD_36]|nr:hypothetical protein FQN54_000793 [Arachnomyces sp. PD_36]